MTDINQSAVDPVANTTGAGYQEAPASQAPGNPTAEDLSKVFAGNLAFATTEEELKNIFSEAGTVTNAQIITRGTRSLGYGFVTFSSESEAQKAISTLNKREIAGREISVESAKPQAVADAEKATKAKSKSRSRKSKSAGASGAAPRRARADEGEEGGAETGPDTEAEKADGENAANGPSKSAKRRQKKKAAAAAAAANGETTAASTTETNGTTTKAAKAPRAKREPKGLPKGEPSKTLVFVANLSFATTDETLKAAFTDYSVKSAHVVKRRVGNRSKGFGFVDFDSEAEQKRAIDSAQNKEIDGRQVTLSVAIQDDRANKDDAPAAAAADAPATEA
ncbi:hypothetical protein BCV70DRAFT_198133 [Testicularia cyperi]|uniref:RRM domain-containing protein n=1 Tax=Testicularia cyperi TaxID=1882483 RepID=A0A317XUW8_9BASI|nr:hypothetical protein BCV70DRAFT_198133 [Testicularia cyperi]